VHLNRLHLHQPARGRKRFALLMLLASFPLGRVLPGRLLLAPAAMSLLVLGKAGWDSGRSWVERRGEEAGE
jgi:hypothetical protein